MPCSHSLSSGHDVYNMHMHDLNVRLFRKVVQIVMFSYHIHTHAYSVSVKIRQETLNQL